MTQASSSITKQERFFNTVGAIDPREHYFLPHRLDWDELKDLIEKKYYLVLHAPRQSGKTTAIIEFVKHLNTEDSYHALYVSIEAAHYAGTQVSLAVQEILKQFYHQITLFLPKEKEALTYLNKLIQEKDFQESSLYDFLFFWSQKSTKPLVLFLDEFDGLTGNSLIALLKQFRTGYTNRPEHFPQTICLVGVRDLHDYYSPFNIKVESLILPDFSEEDIQILYHQHTKDTGQEFTKEAIDYAFEQTQGQPWLVNALAYQACFRDVKDRSLPITKEVLERAKETLIKRCDTHIDALLDRLLEPRVLRIIDAIVVGGGEDADFSMEDLQYVRDLGLISRKGASIANPIYQEIIPRALAYAKQETLNQKLIWYQKTDGSLDMAKLLNAFTGFYQENSEVWLERFAYKESGPHLLLLAFLQRIVNGGGTIHREYALGRKRVDIFLLWKTQRIVIELKIKKGSDVLSKGLEQTADYGDKSDATEMHLVIFDRDPARSWDEKIYHEKKTVRGKTITVWGL